MTKDDRVYAPIDFSLTAGGPLYRFFTNTRLLKPDFDFLGRRLVVLTLLVWLPPFLLSLWENTALGGIRVPFLYDVATHVRFLVALPLLLMADGMVHRLIKPAIEQSVERGIVPPEALPRFNALLASICRWRNSPIAEGVLLALIYSAGHFLSKGTALKTSTWYADFTGPEPHTTKAGLWYGWVSMPIFQFILLRWYYRWGLWISFLWRMSRLPLRLLPTHPDGAAGLSTFARSVVAFTPVLAAQSSIVAGVVAGKLLYEGGTLSAYKFEIVSVVVFLMLMAIAPLCIFIPCLCRAKLNGELEYGTLANRYAAEFDRKWNRMGGTTNDHWLGSSDIQSLADMANSYAVIDKMKLVPFDRDAIIQAAAASLLPLAPLVLFVIPLDQLVVKLLGILF